jgi:selenocysteine-specific elongation factor
VSVHVVTTAGHVDHGKSTLLRALTGMEPDRFAEERARGLTIDLGFVWCDLRVGDDTTTVAFVDVPGHERFVANMLAGAGAAPVALFVVAADDGWSAQSAEHLAILDLLGVHGAVVAVTKVGVAGEDRALEVAADVEARLAHTTLAGAPIVLTDAVAGLGLDELTATLAERLAAAPAAADRRRARLWVDRSFTIAGAGTVVTGTLAGGTLAVGDEVALLPSRQRARIRGLQSLGSSVERARPPARVAVNLAGLDRGDVARGDALVTGATDPADAWVVTDTVDLWVRVLAGQELDRPGAWHLHVGSAETTCTVHPLLGAPLTPDRPGHLRVVLRDALPLQAGDRVVLREAGRRATVGGGRVLDPAPAGRVRGTDARLDRALALDAVRDALDLPADHTDGMGGSRDEVLVRALLEASDGARPAADALAAAGLRPDVPAPAGCTRLDGWLVTDAALRRHTGTATAALERAHAEEPAGPGLDRATLAGTLAAAGAPRGLAEALPDHLATTGVLRRRGPAYALASHAATVAAHADRRRDDLLDALAADPLSPPKLADAAKAAGLTAQEVQQLLQSGQVVRAGGLGFTRAAVEQAVAALREAFGDGTPFTAAQAKDVWGTTRRGAIPLLEHLDTAGVTRFDGQLRTLR